MADPRFAHCPECTGGRVDCPVCDGEGLIETPGQIAADDQLLEELRDAMRWPVTAARFAWGQPIGDVAVDKWFGIVATPGPLCGDLDEAGEQACAHTSCGAILWPARFVIGVPHG